MYHELLEEIFLHASAVISTFSDSEHNGKKSILAYTNIESENESDTSVYTLLYKRNFI